MNNIRYRIARCDEVLDHLNNPKKVVCLSVEREDDIGQQISHCVELTGSQCYGKTSTECVDLAFQIMSSSIAVSANKLLHSDVNIVGNYYVPNL